MRGCDFLRDETSEQRAVKPSCHDGNSCLRRQAELKDHVWTWDFIHDRTSAGRSLKWFAITDEFTREFLALEVDRSITADRIVDVLTHLFLMRGVPKHIRSDNGSEFIAGTIRSHSESASLEMRYIEPGSPWQNGFAESFFSRLRDEFLNVEEFENLAEARWFATHRQTLAAREHAVAHGDHVRRDLPCRDHLFAVRLWGRS
jgi:transposase InsO family protein